MSAQFSFEHETINPLTGAYHEHGRRKEMQGKDLSQGHGEDTRANRRKLKRDSKHKTLRSHRRGK